MGEKQYRMIAIDLDGTLLSPDGTVTPRSRDAVQKALSAGLMICFATGRNWTESRTVLEAVQHFDSAVFVGGAIVMDTKQEVTLHRTMMDPALAREVSAALEATGHAVLALQDTGDAGADYLVSRDLPQNEATRQWMKVTESVVHEVPRLGEFEHPHTIRVGIVAAAKEIEAVKGMLADRFGERILYHNLAVEAYGVEVLEVFDPAVNKWEGVLHVARRHGIEPEQIIAIGDNVNDLPMLRNAGLGVAMGNATPDAKAVAKRIIKPNSEDGLALFLEELVAEHTVAPMHPAAEDDAAA